MLKQAALVLALVVACGKSDGTEKSPFAPIAVERSAKEPPKDPAKEPPKDPAAELPKDPGRGAHSAEAAAQGMVDAISKGDLEAAKRMVPDAAVCKAIPTLAPCPQIEEKLVKGWDQVKATGVAFVGAKIERSAEAAPMPNAEIWTATVPNRDPLKLIAFKIGERYFAPLLSGGAAKAPSTGNEMPVATKVEMTAAQALAVIDEAIQLVGKENPPCDKIVDALNVALPIAYPAATLPPAAIPAIEAMGKCAAEVKRWRAVVMAGTALLRMGEDSKAHHIVRALAEMGEYDKAIALARDLAKKYPNTRTKMMAALTFVYCRAESFDQCQQSAETALAALAKEGVNPKDESVLLNRLLRNLAWVVTGKPKEALADIAAMEKIKPLPGIQSIKDHGATAIERGFFFEVVTVPQLPTGVYHLMGRKDTGALVTIKLRDHRGAGRKFRVEAEVPGVTEKSSNTIELKGREGTVRRVNPPMKMSFDVKQVRSPRPAQLALRVVELGKTGETTVFDETIQIEVLPRDYLPLKRKLGPDAMVPTFGFMGAWITSNDPTVDEFLAKAKLRVPSKSFVGEQGVTVPQIKALFDELKSRGVTYVMDPNVTSDQMFVQRTRLPSEVLTSTNAQCLEGTLLFATLMEAIGVKPIIIMVPGHAFVGWHTVAQDGTKGEPLFVETTMVGGATFEQAVEVATKRVGQELKKGSFKSGSSTIVDVAAIRQAGFSAQPF